MPYNWGPNYIVPSTVTTTYSGIVQLREQFDKELLEKELEELNIRGAVQRIANPWYYRKKDTDTWVKIGESEAIAQNFPVTWDTTTLENGRYEVMGLMHVFVKKENVEHAIARQNVVEITVQN